jgi:pimeloyl-ACP methyl ester carboxylesterase
VYQRNTVTTRRLTTAYYRTGEGSPRKLLLIHGNVSSSVFYLPLFPHLERAGFDVVAPDLRCFGESDALPVDATRGFRDWTEDLAEFLAALGWDRFAAAGWSMGGCVAMQYAIDHGEQLTGLVLINPGSPYGFGGTKGTDGAPLDPPGLASGGGCANAQLVQSLLTGERELPRATLRRVYFKPPFTLPEWEEQFIDEMLKTKPGEGMYPGDTRQVETWPFVAAGDKGICNTMSPTHGDLTALTDIPVKPPVLWVRGDSDIMVSDTSACDFGFLGQTGVVPGWPGAEVIPPQPMVRQTRAVLGRYAARGGRVQETAYPGGHGCHLENPERFAADLDKFLPSL